MGIFDKPLENKRDMKIVELYTLLSHSDFKGNYEDTYVIEVLFALLCLDLNSRRKTALDFNKKELLTLAKELVRIVEIDGELSVYSFYNWSAALCKYIEQDKKSVDSVHKADTYTLRREVSNYLRRNEDEDD